MARAMISIGDQDYDGALAVVQRTRARIGTWPEVEAEEFYIERERSEAALDELEQEILQKKPLSQQEQLEHWLQEAVDSEDFEKAALLRDELKKLREGEG